MRPLPMMTYTHYVPGKLICQPARNLTINILIASIITNLSCHLSLSLNLVMEIFYLQRRLSTALPMSAKVSFQGQFICLTHNTPVFYAIATHSTTVTNFLSLSINCFHVGYGFVNFDSPYSAEQAVIDLANRGYQVQMSRENRVPRQPILAGAPTWQ